jgi:hypothetical protein
MSNIESSFPQNTNNKEYGFKGTQFWIEEIKKSGVFESLSYFNDVITEKNAPHEMSGYNLVLQDVFTGR